MEEPKLKTANDLRNALLTSIEAVIEGRMSISQGNTVALLSEQFYKSVDQEWEMRVYANQHINLDNAKVIRLLEG